MNAAQTRALLTAALIQDDDDREWMLMALLPGLGAPSRYARDQLIEAAREWRSHGDDGTSRDDLAAELHLALAGRLPCMEHVRRHPSDNPAEVAAAVPTSDGHPTLCAECRASAYPMRLP